MKTILKIVVIILIVIAVLALAVLITVKASGAHCSDPAKVKQYEMTNLHANDITADSYLILLHDDPPDRISDAQTVFGETDGRTKTRPWLS